MFKKLFSLAAIGLCILAVAGCAKEQTSSHSSSETKINASVDASSNISSPAQTNGDTSSSTDADVNTDFDASSTVSASSEVQSNATLSPAEATLLPEVHKAIKTDYLSWLKKNEKGFDNLSYSDVRVDSCYGVYGNYQVVRCTAKGQTYTKTAISVKAGKYTFKNTTSQQTLVHYNGNMIGLDKAYQQKVISDSELDEIYDNYPDELK